MISRQRCVVPHLQMTRMVSPPVSARMNAGIPQDRVERLRICRRSIGYLGSQRPCSKPHRNGLGLPRSTFHGQLPEWVGPTGSDHPIGAGPIQYSSSFSSTCCTCGPCARWFTSRGGPGGQAVVDVG